MVFDGGIITIPLMATITVAVLGALGGAAGGCYATTGDWLCRADDPKDFPLSQFDPCNGTEDRVFASWRPTQSSSQAATVTIKASHSHSRSWTRTVEEATASSSARFTLDVVGGAAWFVSRMAGVPAIHVGTIEPKRHSLSATYDLMTQESDALMVTCPPGIVWQWTLEVSRCGEATTAVGTRNVRCTPNVQQPPCCMPGFEAVPENPFSGGCLKTRDNIETRLRSPACDFAKEGIEDASLVEYNKRLSHYAMALHDAPSPPHRPAAAGAVLGITAGLLLIRLSRRRLMHDATLV